MRASTIYATMKITMRTVRLKIRNWTPKPGSGMELAWRLVVLNRRVMIIQLTLAAVSAGIFYVPALFLRRLLQYLQADESGTNKAWGWFCSAGLFVSTAFMHISGFHYRKVDTRAEIVQSRASSGA
jgi:hypothetical protein